MSQSDYADGVQSLLDRLVSLGATPILFGGLLRAFAMERRPQARDIDIVIMTDNFETVQSSLRQWVVRTTRFGGLVLQVGVWRVDLWQLESTWAIREGLVGSTTGIQALLRSTFFNIEAIALTPGGIASRRRSRIYDNGALNAMRMRWLDINLEANPFPELCVLRAYVLSTKSRLTLAPRLVQYLVREVGRLSLAAVESAAVSHYGRAPMDDNGFVEWREALRLHHRRSPGAPFGCLAGTEAQGHLWDDAELAMRTIHGAGNGEPAGRIAL